MSRAWPAALVALDAGLPGTARATGRNRLGEPAFIGATGRFTAVGSSGHHERYVRHGHEGSGDGPVSGGDADGEDALVAGDGDARRPRDAAVVDEWAVHQPAWGCDLLRCGDGVHAIGRASIAAESTRPGDPAEVVSFGAVNALLHLGAGSTAAEVLRERVADALGRDGVSCRKQRFGDRRPHAAFGINELIFVLFYATEIDGRGNSVHGLGAQRPPIRWRSAASAQTGERIADHRLPSARPQLPDRHGSRRDA